MVDEKKTVCLYFDCTTIADHYEGYLVPGDLTFALPVVSTDTTSKPKTILPPFGLGKLDFGTSLVSLGSMVYCIGGTLDGKKDVKVFDINQPELELDNSFAPPMIEARCSPAIIALGKIIYVFGGLSGHRDKEIDSVWAECLDTAMPKHHQKWVALKNPPYRIWMFYSAFARLCDPKISDTCTTYRGYAILIGGRSLGGDHDSILYIVETSSWLEYKFRGFSSSFTFRHKIDPVTVVGDDTMYWFNGPLLMAYDLKSHIPYFETASEWKDKFQNKFLYNGDCTPFGAVLKHLEDNVFCCFTMDTRYNNPAGAQLLQCTKFKVHKVDAKPWAFDYGVGSIQKQVLGLQSYKFGLRGRLLGGLFFGVPENKELENPLELYEDNLLKKGKTLKKRKKLNKETKHKRRTCHHSMADEKKTACLYFDCRTITDRYENTLPSHLTFALPVVSTHPTSKPKSTLPPFGPVEFGTCLVSLGSMVYCIGGRTLYEKHVEMFDINQPELKLAPTFTPEMIEARAYPAVIALGKIIYVFGGLSHHRDREIDSVWAECLDTSMPKHQQHWVALKNPPYRCWIDHESGFARLCDPMIGNTCTIYRGDAILIGGHFLGVPHDAILYIVKTGTWLEYNFRGFGCPCHFVGKNLGLSRFVKLR